MVYLLALVPGIVLMGLGGLLFSRPMSNWVRNWVSPETWQNRPGVAKRKQRAISQFVGAVQFGIGFILTLIGVFAS